MCFLLSHTPSHLGTEDPPAGSKAPLPCQLFLGWGRQGIVAHCPGDSDMNPRPVAFPCPHWVPIKHAPWSPMAVQLPGPVPHLPNYDFLRLPWPYTYMWLLSKVLSKPTRVMVYGSSIGNSLMSTMTSAGPGMTSKGSRFRALTSPRPSGTHFTFSLNPS